MTELEREIRTAVCRMKTLILTGKPTPQEENAAYHLWSGWVDDLYLAGNINREDCESMKAEMNAFRDGMAKLARISSGI